MIGLKRELALQVYAGITGVCWDYRCVLGLQVYAGIIDGCWDYRYVLCGLGLQVCAGISGGQPSVVVSWNCSCIVRLQGGYCPALCMSFRDPNSRLHTYRTRILTTGPTPQPSILARETCTVPSS